MKYTNGIRTIKTADGITKDYILDGDRIIAEKWSNDTAIYYVYNTNGITGFVYNGVPYVYQKNIFGDIIAIYDNAGTKVAGYRYNAFGENFIYYQVGTMGEINPFRYRGYYYDSETGLYYLQSRYYDPAMGRFINADTVDYIDPQTINGINLYVYCYNNPIIYSDHTGHAVDFIADLGFFLWSLGDFIADPSWENAAWLALDTIALATPFIPGGYGKAAKTITKLDTVEDGVNFVKKYNNVVVLGQSMERRVIPYADEIGATYYAGMKNYSKMKNVSSLFADFCSFNHNMAYIAWKSFTGSKFINYGLDASRTFRNAYKVNGLRGAYRLWVSHVTIISERVVACMAKVKNIFRLTIHLL